MKYVSLWSRSRLEPPFFVQNWSRPNLVGAGVGSGNSGLPELEPPKKVAAPQHWFFLHCLSYFLCDSYPLRTLQSCRVLVLFYRQCLLDSVVLKGHSLPVWRILKKGFTFSRSLLKKELRFSASFFENLFNFIRYRYDPIGLISEPPPPFHPAKKC